MQVSAETCMAQIKTHEDIARNHPLESRRTISRAAVTAWKAEAVWAYKREAKRLNARNKLDTQISLEFAAEGKAD